MKKVYIIEAIGTLLLVLLGCGAAVFVRSAPELTVAFVFGAVVLVLAYILGPISGCHLNPAVTTAMMINKRMSLKEGFTYIGFQFLGAFVGILILVITSSLAFGGFDGAQMTRFGANVINDWTIHHSLLVGLIVEIILTFVFVTVILFTTSKKGNSKTAGALIGLTLVICIIVGFNITGGSLNPARSFAPALFAGWTVLKQVWVFILGPILGAVGAAYFSKHLLNTEEDDCSSCKCTDKIDDKQSDEIIE